MMMKNRHSPTLLSLASLTTSILLRCTVFLPSMMTVSQPISCEDALPARLECYDTDGPCEMLPIVPSAFGVQPDSSKGYSIQTLRQHQDSGIYAITEGAYWFMAAVAPRGKCHGKSSSSSTSSSSSSNSGHRYLKSSMMKMRPKQYMHKHNCVEEYEVAIFDFPEGSFVQRDGTGQVVGSLITAAMDEIVFEMHGLDSDKITSVKMVYSHQHMDHVGGATIVRDHIVHNWASRTLDIIGPTAVKEEFEHRIAAEFFSFRAPVPTVLVDSDEDEVKFSVGNEYEFTVTPFPGHTAEKDLAIFFEKDVNGPAILMHVDVVFPGWAPFFNFAITTDLFHFLEAHDMLLDHFDLGDDGIFVGGHLSKLGGRSDIETSKEFANAVIAGAIKGMQTTDFNAIVAAGGPTPLGSVRNIQLIRGGNVKMLDVYEFLLDPSVAFDYQLTHNDIIYIPAAEREVVIEGAINRPCRYELEEGEDIFDAILKCSSESAIEL